MPSSPCGCYRFHHSPTDGGAWFYEVFTTKDGQSWWQAYHDEDCMNAPDGPRRGPFDTPQAALADAESFDN